MIAEVIAVIAGLSVFGVATIAGAAIVMGVFLIFWHLFA